ncbi:perforin-1-like [Colossoma macropomum]|uniref:perforin-1-like n=1 Tax=Colossoma macropomum TaxID=42526 RepID=UPI0018656906|nr:perforin-1-like [Colossoma macropomum]
MAFSSRLVYLAILVLASHVMFSNAAVRVWGLRANGLSGDAMGNRPDPYVKVWCAGVNGGRTETIKDTHSPSWAAEFNFPSCKPNSVLKLEVWDQDVSKDDPLGGCDYRLRSGSISNAKCSLKKGTVYFNYTAK